MFSQYNSIPKLNFRFLSRLPKTILITCIKFLKFSVFTPPRIISTHSPRSLDFYLHDTNRFFFHSKVRSCYICFSFLWSGFSCWSAHNIVENKFTTLLTYGVKFFFTKISLTEFVVPHYFLHEFTPTRWTHVIGKLSDEYRDLKRRRQVVTL